MLFALALATLTTNVAANVVSPSYDFSNAWPSKHLASGPAASSRASSAS